jgi:hypothetical protein
MTRDMHRLPGVTAPEQPVHKGDIMKTHNRHPKSRALVALGITVVVVAALWAAERVAAIGNPDITPVEFGLLSLAPGQTARLNVVNPALQVPPDPEMAARRVRLGFAIYAIGDVENLPDPTGRGTASSRLHTLRLLARQSRVVALLPGEAALFDFTATAAETVHFSPFIVDLDDDGQDTRGPQPNIVPTLQVMEAGRTLFTHPAFVKGFNPQPDPPGIETVGR